MAMILCEIHGTTPATLVSFDIKSSFLNRKRPRLEQYHLVRVTFFNENDVFDYCWLSTDIVNQFQIPVDKVLSLEEFDSYGKLPLELVCVKCFRDWLNKND